MMLNLAVRRKGLPEGYETVNSFIDGTMRPCSFPSDGAGRPHDVQRELYSGHKRGHYIKFQSLFYPNGMIGDLYGPMIGRRHDSYLLRKSGLNNRILNMLHPFLPDTVYHTYGDAAYPHLPRWLKRGGRRNQGALQDNQGQQAAYMILSRSRITVEWGFGKIVNLWGFIDYKKNNKLFLQPLGTYYRVMGFLTNCHTTLYGSQTSTYFDCKPPTLSEYLSGAPDV